MTAWGGWSTGRCQFACLLVIGVVVLAGCSASGDSRAEDSAESERTPEVSRSEQAYVSVRVDGALSFEWEQESPLQIMKVTPRERIGHLVSIGILDFVPIADGTDAFRFAFDLLGGYDGPGRYEIRERAEQLAEQEGGQSGLPSSGLFSRAFLIHLRVIDNTLEEPYVVDNLEVARAFERPLQPCVVEIGDAEATGSLTCPELADSEGDVISLAVTWQPPDS